jgi:predicted NAD/FAD-dependent oxidoreductase
MEMLKKIAIIGSGICGAYLANTLAAKCEVYVFEKARGLGGRSASKRQGETSFDYGVSYFSIQDSDLKSFLSGALFHENIELVDRKIIKLDRSNAEGGIWEQSTEALFVSKPYGNSFAKALLKDIKNIFLETRIQGVVKENAENVVEPRSLNDSKYKLILENAVEFDVDFDIVISTAPAAQSAQIYAKYDDLVKSLSTVKYNPAFVLMFSLKQSAAVFSALAVSDTISQIWNADILKIKNSIIEEIVFNHKKPLRDSATPAFVIKASRSFTENNLEMEHALIEEILLNEFFSIMGFNLELNKLEIDFKHLHRWLYSTPSNKLGSLFLKAKGEEIYAVGDYILEGGGNPGIEDCEQGLGACGVEASLLSARALAQFF